MHEFGEWLGEIGIIEGRSRSATARAVTDGEVEVLTARQFLERVSGDPALARDLFSAQHEAEEDRGQNYGKPVALRA